jgi:hypothetical protein
MKTLIMLTVLFAFNAFGQEDSPNHNHFSWYDERSDREYFLTCENYLRCQDVGIWSQPVGFWNSRRWERPDTVVLGDIMGNKKIMKFILKLEPQIKMFLLPTYEMDLRRR